MIDIQKQLLEHRRAFFTKFHDCFTIANLRPSHSFVHTVNIENTLTFEMNTVLFISHGKRCNPCVISERALHGLNKGCGLCVNQLFALPLLIKKVE